MDFALVGAGLLLDEVQLRTTGAIVIFFDLFGELDQLLFDSVVGVGADHFIRRCHYGLIRFGQDGWTTRVSVGSWVVVAGQFAVERFLLRFNLNSVSLFYLLILLEDVASARASFALSTRRHAFFTFTALFRVVIWWIPTLLHFGCSALCILFRTI